MMKVLASKIEKFSRELEPLTDRLIESGDAIQSGKRLALPITDPRTQPFERRVPCGNPAGNT